MKRSFLLAGTALATISMFCLPAAADEALETVTVTAKLDTARNGIQTQLGASTYKITASDIENQPGGANTLLNQVVLQAPSVAQDSFGQLHIRGEHNGVQYRLNGVILPEGISVFGQTLDPRLISSMQLITGALPAEYGLRTAGIIDVTTKSGVFEPGGQVSIYGGSHGTINPSFDYGGSSGNFNYFVSGDYMQNGLGIESPDGRANPVHDNTSQYHGFGYFEDILDAHSRLTAVIGTSNDFFQIPNTPGLTPSLGLTVNGVSTYPSTRLNETQREITHFGIVSWLHSQGNLDVQISGLARYSSLTFTPDRLGDLLFDGIAQKALKHDTAYGLQADAAYALGNAHTIRGGLYIQTDRATSATASQVLQTDASGNPLSDTPVTIIDNGAETGWSYSFYLQDEWKPFDQLTINYGLRYDDYSAFSSGNQLSPRVNLVWKPVDGTTIHAGYARYFSPPPFELVGSESIAKFVNTTAAPSGLTNTTPMAERANYYDVGYSQTVGEHLTLGVDSYYKLSRDLIDEGQFGAPIILTPFNYAKGKQYGIEFTGNYQNGGFSAYGNLAFAHALGKHIISSQFQFAPSDLAYIATHYIHLDHDQALTASGGLSYGWDNTRASLDMLYGSGLRKDGAFPNGAHVPGYFTMNIGMNHDFTEGALRGVSIRLDVINLFDKTYLIRDGSGIGVGAPQYGARRGIFVGVSKVF
ncbi:MAG: TonB-dependent receptor [Alphaproteobacteria bacterium]|nr:TonB-dependent receptor [Alphaproteobacteria bacterium]MDE2011454.1 TonB-dependent receptor [Alphaproteobacteria bacterium]MDE2071845.1 TonB-dependent receptor [Alphaproteobacteria bacterium]MDE2350482.1 TonB-dependent receptor [Alphaproteobacteria bacterium]